MKRVCFCLRMPHDSYVGGIAAIVNQYISSNQVFNQYGYDTCVFDYQNSRIFSIKFSPLQTVLYGIGQWKHIKRLIREEPIDVVHIHTSCRSLFWKDVILLAKISKTFDIKVVITIHVGERTTVFEKIPYFFRGGLISRLNRYSSQVLFLSDRMRKQFIESGLDSKKSATLYNFFDDLLLASKNETNLENSNSVLKLLFVGMINRDKGVLELLQALRSLKEIPLQLDICGTITDDSIKEQFMKLLKDEADRVTLHGYIKGEEKNRVFNNADILVLPSYHEGFPLVILEALATNCGIIATKVGALPEILSEENVRWVDVGNVKSLSNAIMELYEDREKLICMKENNLKLSTQFKKDAHIKKLCEIYQK